MGKTMACKSPEPDKFDERYARAVKDVHLRIEREVIGAEYGANGYTTRAQADELIKALKLAPGMRLLDVGAGRGWPGLYLAEQSGCEAVITDVPQPALEAALQSIKERSLAGTCSAVRATGNDLPLKPRTFDTVVHTDVL